MESHYSKIKYFVVLGLLFLVFPALGEAVEKNRQRM